MSQLPTHLDGRPITQAAAEKLWQHCFNFIKAQQIGCAETIAQTDRVIINAYDFIEGVCEIVGYAPYDDEDEE